MFSTSSGCMSGFRSQPLALVLPFSDGLKRRKQKKKKTSSSRVTETGMQIHHHKCLERLSALHGPRGIRHTSKTAPTWSGDGGSRAESKGLASLESSTVGVGCGNGGPSTTAGEKIRIQHPALHRALRPSENKASSPLSRCNLLLAQTISG